MPTVVKYGDKRQVATNALPGARLTAAETAISQGAGVAAENENKALVGARLGEGVRVIGQRLYAGEQAEIRAEREREKREAKARAVRTNVTEGENSLFLFENKYYDDPETGVLNRQGKAAFSTPEEADAAYEQASAAIAETMGTDEAKAMFEDIRVRHRAANQLRVNRQVSNEMQKHEAGVLKARVENGVEETVKYNTTMTADGHFDLSAGRKQLEDTIAIFRQGAKNLGLDDEVIAGQVLAMQTRAHEGTIDIFAANGNMRAAKAYYEEAKALGQIETGRQDEIDKTLKAGTTKKEAQIETERIVQMGGTDDEQLAAARKIDDADVQDEVVGRLKVRHQEVKTKKREDHEALMLSLANKVRATKSAQFTPQESAQLEAPEHEMFRNYAISLASGIPIKTNQTRFAALMGMAHNDPKAFMELDLTKDINNLSPSDLQEMLRLQLNKREGNEKAVQAAMGGYLTQTAVVTEVLRQAKIDPTPKEGSAAASQIAALRLAVDEQIEAWKIENPGKAMSSQQVQAIADSMLKETVTKPGTGSLRSFFKFGGAESYADQRKRIGLVTLDDISAADRAEAAEYLKGKDRPVNDENIVQVYRAFLARTSKPAAK